MLVPVLRCVVGKDNIRPRKSVCVVDKKRYVVLGGEFCKMMKLVVCKDVSGRVSRTAYAHCANVVVILKVFFEKLEVDIVFECMVGKNCEVRRNADECARFKPLVCIAYVFGNKREQNFFSDDGRFFTARSRHGKGAGKQVEQIEECALRTVHNRNVLGSDFPAVCFSKILCDSLNKTGASLRTVVAADKVVK